MSATIEQDYIGLSAAERSPDKISTASSTSSNLCPEDEKSSALNLKETELRLGLPGSESPERKDVVGPPSYGSGVALLFGKTCVSGAKRGFSDAIDGSGKWNLSINGGGSGKDVILFAPLGGESGGDGVKNFNTLQSCLPGTSLKEVSSGPDPVKPIEDKKIVSSSVKEHGIGAPASKARVVGWPPIGSFRKSTLATNLSKNNDAETKSGPSCLFVKVSMDGAPYLRKVDLKSYSNYSELSSALEMLFSCFTIGQCSAGELSEKEGLKEKGVVDDFRGSEHVLTYEDKDGDWMLVGDVPWEMFIGSCKRLRIMRGSEAIGLAPRAMQKAKNQS
ncbi:OLC1v1014824C4 [Oldenlandia corymbosa var. corymbosa]|uniref:Auxin-responsive protein n=1 Tax=Oldenlandia corymbosa var. corymbosa TaxID=529605 RepID=A0AAV1E278_OLDCO|nr:OLC1v1014824C4 [Oldenlandia corymbosa var. corymbosa]